MRAPQCLLGAWLAGGGAEDIAFEPAAETSRRRDGFARCCYA
eukprot:CAMPEP_0170455292 /NCGR_PEP_ID=MMETSP0123-20130129/3306_1 /TAXON_ID=182087 /ORGANISM="Favella ehrenbergii, Strain Fehren 1" /LENGTH=41 /DNA_ID= /DNA_START= /DNA_END= /DNA_ORIENTATION=